MEEEIADVMPEVVRRWEWLDKEELIKRVVSREFGRFLAYYADAPEIEEVQESASKSRSERGKQGSKGARKAEEGYTRLFINVGKIDGFYAKEIIGLINRSVKGQQVEIGRIDLMKNFAFVEVAAEQANDVIKSMKHGVTVKGRSVVCDVADKNTDDKESRRGKNRGEKKENTRGEKSFNDKKGRGAKEKPSKGKYQKESNAHTSRQKQYSKEDWMKFLNPEMASKKRTPDFEEEGWARRRPKKKK